MWWSDFKRPGYDGPYWRCATGNRCNGYVLGSFRIDKKPCRTPPGTCFWRMRYNSWWKHIVTAMLLLQGLMYRSWRELRCLGGQGIGICASLSESINLAFMNPQFGRRHFLFAIIWSDRQRRWQNEKFICNVFKKKRGEKTFSSISLQSG